MVATEGDEEVEEEYTIRNYFEPNTGSKKYMTPNTGT
jgi:hypothetical protein